MEKIQVRGKSFVDSLGRERIFNGVNLVHKGAEVPGEARKDYTQPWDEKSIAALSGMGVNLVRLGLIWDAVEPKPKEYDTAYLDDIAGVVDLCAKYGIYVYLDMHQDLFAAEYSDGAPDWAVITDGYKHRKQKVIWAESYFFDKATQHAMDNFWRNTPVCGRGLQDYFTDMWRFTAKYLSGRDNIIGYDIYNEPGPGADGGRIFKRTLKHGLKVIMSRKVKKLDTLFNLIRGDAVTAILGAVDDPEVFRDLTSGGDMLNVKFCVDTYYPFLQKVASAIREVDETGIIVVENSYWSNVSMPWPIPRLRFNGEVEPQLAFAPHGYDFTVDSVYTNTASNSRVKTIFDAHKKTQDKLDVPVIAGEWGGMVPGSEEYPHLEFLLDYFDSNKWSQTYWAYYPGLENEKIMKIISRPYPQAVYGRIDYYRYSRDAGDFTLQYDSDGIKNETVIYTPFKPSEVETGGKYTVSECGDGYIVKIKVKKGLNHVRIKP